MDSSRRRYRIVAAVAWRQQPCELLDENKSALMQRTGLLVVFNGCWLVVSTLGLNPSSIVALLRVTHHWLERFFGFQPPTISTTADIRQCGWPHTRDAREDVCTEILRHPLWKVESSFGTQLRKLELRRWPINGRATDPVLSLTQPSWHLRDRQVIQV